MVHHLHVDTEGRKGILVRTSEGMKTMARRSRVRQYLLAALLIVGSGIGFAVAQENSEGGESTEGEEGTMEVQRRSDLTPAQQLEEAIVIKQRGTALSRRIAGMLDEARREQDIIRVTCVNDKLTQVNANLRTAEQRIESLEAAVESQDRGRANHEYTVIIVLGQKFVVLDREATQCIGQDIFETGATRVDTTIDPDTPNENPVILPTIPPGLIPFLPPPGSPSI